MASNVGVNVVEVDGLAAPSIAGAATSVAAFAGITARGVPNQPVFITTFAEFQARFGGYSANGYVAYSLDGFYSNGGQNAYVNRIVATGAAPALLTLLNRESTPAPVLQVRGGYRGRTDPGTWGENLRVDVVDDPLASTRLSSSTVANATSAQVISVAGIGVGSVVRLSDAANVAWRKITALDPNTRTISWTAPTPPVFNVATTEVTTGEYRVTVRYAPSAGADAAVVEDWRTLSMEPDLATYVVRAINDAFTGSTYITVDDLSSRLDPGDRIPAPVTNQTLVGSAEPLPAPTDFTGNPLTKSGFHAFDALDVTLLVAPDVHRLAPAGRVLVVRGALDYCAARGDCMYIGSAPDRGAAPGTTPRSLADYTQLESDYVSSIESYSASFQAAKTYGALYAPWILVSDPLASGPTPVRFIPADGHILGVYARTDDERGIFKAPAGLQALVRGALDVSARFTDAQHTELVRGALVNGVRPTSGAGIVVAASRTLSTDTRWWFVNVRLLFNFVKSSLRDGLRFVRQEPHDEALRRRVKLNVVTPFLLGLWRQGAFGSDPPQAVFTIICDATNNPPDQVDLGFFRIEVYFYPAKPVETILIVVGQQPNGATASEA
jgi:phage tail sheath protein FI